MQPKTDAVPVPPLRSYQRDFVEGFLSPNACRLFSLCAPPGAGKGVTVRELVRRTLQLDAGMLGLLIAPRPLAEQYRAILSEYGVPCLYLDRFAFRTIQDLGGCARALGAPRLVLTSFEFMRAPEVVEELESLRWSLVVVDEAQFARGAVTLDAVSRVVGVSNRTMLVGSSVNEELMARIAKLGVQQVEWTTQSLERHFEASGPARVRTYQVPFSRTPWEIELVRQCSVLAEQLIAEGAHPSVGDWIRRRCSIGVPALEDLLGRWHRSGVPRSASDDTDEDLNIADVGTSEQEPRRLRLEGDALRLLDAVLDFAESIDVDSRLAALLQIVQDLLSPDKQTKQAVILVDGRPTAYFVVSALRELDPNAVVLDPSIDREKAIALLSQGATRVVVATRSGLREGIDLSAACNLVVYDPEAAPARERQLARFDRFGRTTPLTVVELVPRDVSLELRE